MVITQYKHVNRDCMASLVCCVIQLQLPRGVVNETFPSPLDVRVGVVGMEKGRWEYTCLLAAFVFWYKSYFLWAGLRRRYCFTLMMAFEKRVVILSKLCPRSRIFLINRYISLSTSISLV